MRSCKPNRGLMPALTFWLSTCRPTQQNDTVGIQYCRLPDNCL